MYTGLYFTIPRDRVKDNSDEDGGALAGIAPTLDPLAPSREVALARHGGPARPDTPLEFGAERKDTAARSAATTV